MDVGHRHLRVVLADWTLTPVAERRVDSPPGQTATETLAMRNSPRAYDKEEDFQKSIPTT